MWDLGDPKKRGSPPGCRGSWSGFPDTTLPHTNRKSFRNGSFTYCQAERTSRSMWIGGPLVSRRKNPLPNMLNELNGIVRLPPPFETNSPGREDRRGELHFPLQGSRVFFWKSTPCSAAFKSLNASRYESILPKRVTFFLLGRRR